MTRIATIAALALATVGTPLLAQDVADTATRPAYSGDFPADVQAVNERAEAILARIQAEKGPGLVD